MNNANNAYMITETPKKLSNLHNLLPFFYT